MKHKADVFERFVTSEREICNKFGRPLRVLRSDNGREYVNDKIKRYMQSKGIIHERTALFTPEENERAERDNRTIIECARTLLNSKDLPSYLWAEAVNTAVYLLNRASTCDKDRTKTPYEIWSDKKPDLSHVRVFGSTAYKYVPKQLTTKFDKRASKTIVVGYEDNSSNYRLYNCISRKVTVGRHVIFMEDSEEALPTKQLAEDVEIFDAVIENQDEEADVEWPAGQQIEEADEQAEAVEQDLIAPAPREPSILQPR